MLILIFVVLFICKIIYNIRKKTNILSKTYFDTPLFLIFLFIFAFTIVLYFESSNIPLYLEYQNEKIPQIEAQILEVKESIENNDYSTKTADELWNEYNSLKSKLNSYNAFIDDYYNPVHGGFNRMQRIIFPFGIQPFGDLSIS